MTDRMSDEALQWSFLIYAVRALEAVGMSRGPGGSGDPVSLRTEMLERLREALPEVKLADFVERFCIKSTELYKAELRPPEEYSDELSLLELQWILCRSEMEAELAKARELVAKKQASQPPVISQPEPEEPAASVEVPLR